MNHFKFEEGEFAYLSRRIVEPACGDHPALLLGRFAEKVKLIDYNENTDEWYVEKKDGGKWHCFQKDLMYTKPLLWNGHSSGHLRDPF
ncbi:MAG: hypothetical protein K0U78_14885 [Actinomycetia bacterium]|nr:hypothetical protein [Actinomycetes bacterium]